MDYRLIMSSSSNSLWSHSMNLNHVPFQSLISEEPNIQAYIEKIESIYQFRIANWEYFFAVWIYLHSWFALSVFFCLIGNNSISIDKDNKLPAILWCIFILTPFFSHSTSFSNQHLAARDVDEYETYSCSPHTYRLSVKRAFSFITAFHYIHMAIVIDLALMLFA